MIPDPENWEFDVITSPLGPSTSTQPTQSRVIMSRTEFPDWRAAAETAACIVNCIHGGMPTQVLPRY